MKVNLYSWSLGCFSALILSTDCVFADDWRTPSWKPVESGQYGNTKRAGIALDGPWIYIASGKVPWYIVAYNTQTGEVKTLLESDRLKGYAKVGSIAGGATGYMIEPKQNPFAAEYFQSEKKRIDFWIKDGKLYPRHDHQDLNAPWQTEPLAAPWEAAQRVLRNALAKNSGWGRTGMFGHISMMCWCASSQRLCR